VPPIVEAVWPPAAVEVWIVIAPTPEEGVVVPVLPAVPRAIIAAVMPHAVADQGRGMMDGNAARGHGIGIAPVLRLRWRGEYQYRRERGSSSPYLQHGARSFA